MSTILASLAQIGVEPGSILSVLGIGVSGWVLKELVQLKSEVAVLSTKLDNIAGMKSDYDRISVPSSHGRRYGGTGEYKHMARIPDGVMSALLAIKPDFLQDRKAFYRWLQRHPEFAAYKKEG